MGYRVETYSLQELSRISMPGAVVPCLFWCIPVGGWPQGGVAHKNNRTPDAWWSWFTEQDTRCHEIGLLLIKSRQWREQEAGRVDLKSLQATLTELMPPGAGRFIDPQASIGRGQQLLVLSAAYPQPGWGVLLACREPEQFEQLIDEAIEGLGRNGVTPDLSPIINARNLYRRRQRHDEEEPTRSGDVSGTETRDVAIVANQSIHASLRDAIECLTRRDVDAGVRLLKEACHAAPATETSDEKPQRWIELGEQASLCQAALRLLNAGEIVGHERAGELCDQIKAAPRAQSRILKAVTDNALKRLVGTCVSLMERGVADSAEACVQWARDSFEPLVSDATESARRELVRVESRLASLLAQKTIAEESWQRQRAAWLEQSRDLHAAGRKATSAATEAVWELGPSFLVELERVCREHGIEAHSIPWDPARMVGWKLAASGPECGIALEATDLWSLATNMAKKNRAEKIDPEGPQRPQDGAADGGYFTDYVHYVAMSKPDATPYSVTRELLQQFMPTQLARLIKVHRGEVRNEMLADRPALARQVLDVLGWRERDRACEQSLAGCIVENADGSVSVRQDITLRPVVESFCKDFIDTVVQELGFDEERLWTEVRHRHPLYRSHGGRDDWNTEVNKLTVGPAAMLCEALLPIAFPTQVKEAAAVTVALRKLGAALNPSTHHAPGGEPQVDVAGLLRTLLSSAHALVKELPWHLEATAVYGEQPQVLSGLAWSHSSVIPRQIRVMDWTNAARGRSLTLWNKTGRNPIITDPEFIRRPGRGLDRLPDADVAVSRR